MAHSWLPTGHRSRSARCALSLRIFPRWARRRASSPSARARFRRRASSPRPAGRSSSSATIVRCATARACSKNIASWRICWPTARRSRACSPRRAEKPPSPPATPSTKCTKRPRASTSTKKPSRGRPFKPRRTPARPANCSPVCIAPRVILPRRRAGPSRLSPASPSLPRTIRPARWRATSTAVPRSPAIRPSAAARPMRSIFSRPFTPSWRRSCPHSAPFGRTTICMRPIFSGAIARPGRAPRPKCATACSRAGRRDGFRGRERRPVGLLGSEF